MTAGTSRGRRLAEAPHPYRSEYARDRDRIVHSRAFRRLEAKTQVFSSRFSDHFRNRLTHTIEVAQIARTLANVLQLDEDLTEFISSLPSEKQQPNLVFAVVRHLYGTPRGAQHFKSLIEARRDPIRAMILARTRMAGMARASGTEAADVLAWRSIVTTTRSAGRPSLRPVLSMILLLAW